MFYGSASGFLTYHVTRGRVIPASWTTPVIESGLLVASEWLDSIYADSWIGTPTAGFTQVRQWPRTDAVINRAPDFNNYPSRWYYWFPSSLPDPYTFPDNVVPDQVINATYEAAFRHLTTPESLRTDFTPYQYKSVSVDGAISVEYAQNVSAANDIQLQIQAVSALMAPLLDPQKNFSGLSGGVSRV